MYPTTHDKNVYHAITHGTEWKPNYCVVCGVILHESRAQQCHTSLKVKCGAADSSQRVGYDSMYHTKLVFFLCHILMSSDLSISYIEAFCAFENAYHMVQNVYYMIKTFMPWLCVDHMIQQGVWCMEFSYPYPLAIQTHWQNPDPLAKIQTHCKNPDPLFGTQSSSHCNT